MLSVNMHEAKSKLSALVAAVESGREGEVILTRDGKPAARIAPLREPAAPRRRGGLAKGKYLIPDGIEHEDEMIRRMFEDGPIFPDEEM